MSDADGSVSHHDQSKPQSTCEFTESETMVSHSDHHCTNDPGFGDKPDPTAGHGPHRDRSGDDGLMFVETTEVTAYCLAGCFLGEFIGLAIGVSLGFNPFATIMIATAFGFASAYRWSGWSRLTWQRETISIAMFLFAVNVANYHLGGVAALSILAPQFWLSYLLALPLGFIATWPVNWWLLTPSSNSPATSRLGDAMKDARPKYIPALGYHWLTGFYDPIVALSTRERRIKTALLEQAELKSGDVVLDLGCGSGTLALMGLQTVPDLRISAVDGDPAMLGQARRKAAHVGAKIAFDQALAQKLPYRDASFDAVLSSLLFHHLDRATKLAALQESLRVLKPGGALNVADWGGAANPLMRLVFHAIQLLDGYATTADNVAGRLPEFMLAAGFVEASETHRYSTMLGTMCLYRARKPPRGNRGEPRCRS